MHKDSKIPKSNVAFKIGDKVILLRPKIEKKWGKLATRWLGDPYLIVHDIRPNGNLQLATHDGQILPNWQNQERVKPYFDQKELFSHVPV